MSFRQSNNLADCCSVLIKTEGCEEEPEVDVEGVEGESLLMDNRESNIEAPRRRDSSDPVNLSLNSGASVTSDGSHDIHRSGLYTHTLILWLVLRNSPIVFNASVWNYRSHFMRYKELMEILENGLIWSQVREADIRKARISRGSRREEATAGDAAGVRFGSRKEKTRRDTDPTCGGVRRDASSQAKARFSQRSRAKSCLRTLQSCIRNAQEIAGAKSAKRFGTTVPGKLRTTIPGKLRLTFITFLYVSRSILTRIFNKRVIN